MYTTWYLQTSDSDGIVEHRTSSEYVRGGRPIAARRPRVPQVPCASVQHQGLAITNGCRQCGVPQQKVGGPRAEARSRLLRCPICCARFARDEVGCINILRACMWVLCFRQPSCVESQAIVTRWASDDLRGSAAMASPASGCAEECARPPRNLGSRSALSASMGCIVVLRMPFPGTILSSCGCTAVQIRNNHRRLRTCRSSSAPLGPAYSPCHCRDPPPSRGTTTEHTVHSNNTHCSTPGSLSTTSRRHCSPATRTDRTYSAG